MKSPQPQEHRDEKPSVTLETAERLAHEAYAKAFADAKTLFDTSLQIDQKMSAGIEQVNRRWKWYIKICSAIVAIGALVGIPQLMKSVKESVTEQFVGKEAERQINQFTDTKVSSMIVASVSNTEERVKTTFTQYMDEQVKSFEQRAEELDERIKEAEEKINVYELGASARTGNRKDFEVLVELSKGTGRASHVAGSTVEEIRKSFEQKKNSPLQQRPLLGYLDGRKKAIPEDELIVTIYDDSIGRSDGAINSLADKNEKKYVAILIHAVKSSQYLDIVYTAIRGVEQLTGESFPALGIQETLDWWAAHETDSSYHCAFEYFLEVQKSPDESEDAYRLQKAKYLSEWMREMPNQFYSSAQVAGMLLSTKEDAENNAERKELLKFAFDYWGQESPKSVEWYVYKAVYLAKFEAERLIDFVNDRLREHPQFEDELRHGVFVFTPKFFEIPAIHWPSKNIDKPQVEKDAEQE